ncbi:hypothetical protein [Sorangium sp. So ce1000]|uniref:hypothetical protein n=1 Tax=Sorangium sp. So ce1000 TaxID=3133325 RepID=UPI003F6005E5
MHTRIRLALAALMGAPACGAADDTSEARADRGSAENVEETPRNFYVGLARDTTAESVIPQILEAGRPELAAACADRPEAWIRLFNPLDAGAYADVPCSLMLHDDAAAAEESAVPVSEGDEPIGAAQQRWSPVGLACGVLMLGSSLVSTFALCPRARNPHDRQGCDILTAGSFSTFGVMCMFL